MVGINEPRMIRSRMIAVLILKLRWDRRFLYSYLAMRPIVRGVFCFAVWLTTTACGPDSSCCAFCSGEISVLFAIISLLLLVRLVLVMRLGVPSFLHVQ